MKIINDEIIKDFMDNKDKLKFNNDYIVFPMLVTNISFILSMIFGDYRYITIPIMSTLIAASIYFYYKFIKKMESNITLYYIIGGIYAFYGYIGFINLAFLMCKMYNVDYREIIIFFVLSFPITIIFSIIAMILTVLASKKINAITISSSAIILIFASISIFRKSVTDYTNISSSLVIKAVAFLGLLFVLVSIAFIFRLFMYRRIHRN